MRIVIRGGRLLDPANGIDRQADLYLAERRVVGVGQAPDGFSPDRVLDARGRVVCPGLIDLCARLREPGQEHKATIASETHAAARNGITTLVMPADTDPVADEPAVVELIRRRARAAGFARVRCIGALTRGLDGELLAEMAALKEVGCVGVGNAARPVTSTLVMRRAMEYAATLDLTVFLTPLDPWLANGCAHDGPVATRLGLPGIPVAAETAALARDLALIEETGVRAHMGRLSSRRAVELVAEAQARGLPVTADVAAHQLHLTEQDLGRFDSLAHVLPPLRSTADRDALRDGLARGVLGAVCSDHQPHEADAKLNPFPDTEPGSSGLDTLLSLTLGLVADDTLSLSDAIGLLSTGPAAILGLESGRLELGAPADVCVFDPHRPWTPGPATLSSRGHNTPFLGRELRGRVDYTLVNGRLIYETPEAGQ